jgi:hypothetical protein
VATAGPGAVSRVIAGWPALALLIAVKLLSGMLDQRAGVQAGVAATPVGAAPARDSAGADQDAYDQSADRPGTANVLPPGIAALFPAARAARDELRRDGHPLTRDRLAAQLRATGHPIGNSRLTSLLQALRNEVTASPAPAGSVSRL